ncbi:MAG: hypothetical protein J0L56_04120 [Chitinophagales bacterium]|nr:hypothetical protein [Chitinophagales bacterium]
MMMKQPLYKIVLLGLGIFSCSIVFAQKDTTKGKSVDIRSAFKPVLREAAKINFNATPPSADTTKPALKYEIPNQNLALAFTPGSLKPLALNIDSGGKWDNSSYIKAGFGSLRTPYIQAGFSFGDGTTAGANIYAKHVSSQGKREYQDFTNTQVRLSGFYKTAGNHEWNASIGMKQDRTYKYGYEPQTLSFTKDSLKQNFQTIAARVGMHNINKTEFGLTYAPEVKIDVFTDNLKNNESNTVVNLPLEKSVGKTFAVNLGLTFDLTRLSPKDKTAFNNTIYYVSPSVLFKTPKVNLQAGIRPSWDNKTFKMFPNVLAEVGTEDQRFFVNIGWTGYIRKTTYQYLASQNPWLWLPSTFKNSWIEERFLGLKGSVGDHFTYSAKAGFNKITNQPLFVNDTTSGLGAKSFLVVNEPRINVLHIGGQLGYTVQEKFSVIAGWNFNQYTGLKEHKRAWGLIPLELNAAMRVQVIKDLWLKADVFGWTGPQYRKADGVDNGKLKGALDLNAGLEFKITKNLNLWTQFNNITNQEYQRWNQYRVYGFNFVGGVVFSFDQKN